MDTASIKAALRARFCSPEWALMFEVGNATGLNQRRWADAVAMNLYPSRGLEIHGFEIKASRSDWTRELKNPDKSAPVQQYCDRWWIVAPPGVVKPEELPPTWGLYEAKNGKIVQSVAAPKLDAKPMDRGFSAAMLRRVSELDEGVLRAAVSAEVDRARKDDRTRVDREIEHRTRQFAEMKTVIDEIEKISGVKIDRWGRSADIGRAVKLVLSSGITSTYDGIMGARNSVADSLKKLDEALALVPVLPPEATPRVINQG